MVHLFENLDLSDGTSLPLHVDELILVVDFDCQSLPSLFVDSLLHNSISSLSKTLAHAILANACIVEGSKFRCWYRQKLVCHRVFIMDLLYRFLALLGQQILIEPLIQMSVVIGLASGRSYY
jgi:hypothetical protein